MIITSKKENIAYWEGFNMCQEIVFNTLKNYDIDFSKCTDNNQICEIEDALEEQIIIYRTQFE
jgi:hypothetical protein